MKLTSIEYERKREKNERAFPSSRSLTNVLRHDDGNDLCEKIEMFRRTYFSQAFFFPRSSFH